MSKVSYLHEQSKSWDRARGVYYAILSSIEEGDLEWDSSLAQFDLMCPPVLEKTEGKQVSRTNKTVVKKEFFCKEFQKGECLLQAPHRAWIRSSFESVEHFCHLCFKAKLGKLPHNPMNEQCTSKK